MANQIMDTTKYPVGIQIFENLRKGGYAYVDKTGYIYDMVTKGSRTYFLSRPRRFGKSLLLSTIEAYFSGRKDLFEGLAIYNLENEWAQYPVLRFDFSSTQASDTELLIEYIEETISDYASDFGITDIGHIKSLGLRFGTLIKRIHRVTGKQVVVLIDEYDCSVHDVLDDDGRLFANQDVLRPFFAQIKAQEQYLRFAFITGVSRFRNYTIFSGFNNPDDISMESAFAGLCGITKRELLDNFHAGIQALANKHGISFEQTLDKLRQKYDGYRFSTSNELVFNPFSILNCLKKGEIEDYWITSGISKVFVKYLSKSQFQILELENLWVDKKRMESTYSAEDPIPLLFQSGYLTIRDYDSGLYLLGIPNGEVRSALVEDLIPKYMGISRNNITFMVKDISAKLNSGDVDGFMTNLQSLVSQIPYHEMDVQNLEKTYHLVIYQLFLMLGVDARSEVAISGGRIDMVVQTFGFVYIFEFKLGGSVDEALSQIDDHGYALPWSADGRKVYKIGAVFSPKTRTLSQWRAIGANDLV